ncbi:hypothetical protein VDS34_18110 [Xanthomonas campestris pv. campestris]|jgi:hypothetical protein|uniref:hypothetical protein n=1 Tax=Xanthomonas campestris TaxID=339 RepID=UPI0025A24FA4|nr:hypothetical protein [Xanthomonas campestris]MDM7672469.1 hypothetical protein [Xanthomonas campestris pv. campestris]MDM7685364.1 hypothetical protein [Xanthomonas campestris pv. campestris]MDM7693457.1 hypothetical protein [Xanthomonas campestris pv. campestris]MDM7697637.1 hypothetical protein [Xanthomonas campestris pv. campestris]MDM7756092.1 hypothetical protein [Xanthomonas campestris pv. campestris]
MPIPLFDLGRTVATPGALEEMAKLGLDAVTLLRRHITGDDSEMSAEDQEANQMAIEHGGRVFSAYTYQGIRIWVITEHDRSSTTILLPCEY